MSQPSKNGVKRSIYMYLLEAAFEYLISILVTGSFLASLTKELGFSDTLTGVLSSVISLGCLFQLLSLFIRKTTVKRIVILFSIINQLFFMLLYVIPLTDFGKQTKIILFAGLIFTAYLIYNMVHPHKINWLMSLVEDNRRGVFTANKEIISLVSGMVFSFGMGTLIDHFSNMGRTRTAFVLAAIVLFVLMVLHTLTMIFAVEVPTIQRPQKDIKSALCGLFENKKVICITLVFLLYYISTYISTPFYGTYQIGELGLSLKFVSAMIVFGSFARIAVSRFWGSYADKNSFAKMTKKCFIFFGLSQICVIFATPSTGKVMFILYYVLNGIALGGINSALINLIFEHIPRENGAEALALTQAIAGVVGFLATLCVSPLVSCIQNNGCHIFGVMLYAQQIVSIFAVLFTTIAIFIQSKFL